MKKLFFILIVIFSLGNGLFAQHQSTEELFDDAEFFFATEEYKEALYLFLQLIKRDPDNANFNFRTGMTYLNIPGEETKAIPYFLKATSNISLKYKDKDLEEYRAPHHTWFYLGNAYRINNELDKALEAYDKFKDLRKFEKKYNVRIVENEIKACERAKIIQDSPIPIKKMNLGISINNGSQNFLPVVDVNEERMVFIQSRKFYEAVMYSYKENGDWIEPVNITPQIGSDGNLFPTAISPDGKELLLVKRKNSSDGDIYISKLEGKFWTKAEKLGSNINTFRNEDYASFAASDSGIFFSSERRGGEGKLDIYYAKRISYLEFGDPVNLGPKINTPGNETSAFQIGNTLYFTSTSHFNMGGFDVFYSIRNNDGSWGDIVNLGYPINTTNDNKFFQPVKDGTIAYMALFNQEENYGYEDIYRIVFLPPDMPEPIKKVLFNKSFKLKLSDEESNEEINIIYDYKTNSFKVKSNNQKSYKILLEK